MGLAAGLAEELNVLGRGQARFPRFPGLPKELSKVCCFSRSKVKRYLYRLVLICTYIYMI